MDDDSLSGLLVILLLILTQGFLSLIHVALTNIRSGQIRDLAEDDNMQAQRVLALITTPNLKITMLVLILFLRFLSIWVTLVTVTPPIATSNPDIAPPVIEGVFIIIVALLTIIMSETVPEAIGTKYAKLLAMTFAGTMQLVLRFMSPVIALLLFISRGISRIFASEGNINTVTEEEIMTLIDAGYTGGTIEDEEKEMIYSVLQLDQTRISEVMVPRMDVIAVEINESLQTACQLFVESGYSRLPVYEDDLDRIKGVLYAKDLLALISTGETDSGKTVSDLMRNAYFVSETINADAMLKEMQTQKVHLAIITDEYGGTAGVVTIEDIIEEIIGDIQDEYDLYEEAEYEKISPDEYHMDASIDLDDFNDMLDVDLPTEDMDTLGGYIYTHFGRVPRVGEEIETDELIIRVLSVDGRRLGKVHVQRKREEDQSLEGVTVQKNGKSQDHDLDDSDTSSVDERNRS